ncbi:acyl-CoA dehydrogenase [Pseudomonadota bacterium]
MNNLQEPTAEEMLARAEALVPKLSERATATETSSKIHPDTIRDLHDTGLFRLVQPARVGGGEFDYRLMLEITTVLGKGCGSTAWVYVDLACHHWMLGMWPEAAQNQLWNHDADVLIASSMIYPMGKARRSDDGYQLSGRWPFASGIDCSDWIMLGGMVEPQVDGDKPERRMFLVEKTSIEVLDTWQVSGLCGTGSKDVVVSDVKVPEYMTLAAADTLGGDTPGSVVNPSSLYKLPVLGLFPHIIAAPIIGMVEGVCNTFVSANTAAVSTYNASKVASYQSVQIHVANATAAVEAAKLMINANCDEATETFDAGKSCTLEQKHRWRRDAAYAANRCFDALQGLYKSTGGRGAYKTNPIQRHYRDASVGISHISMSWDVMGAEYGNYALGLGGNPFV